MTPRNSQWSRRDVVKTAGASLVIPLGMTEGSAAASPREQPLRKVIGIQVGAVSFVDEGVERVLDIVQERAHVNALFLAVFSYGRGIAGRQVPGQPLPDHGKQEYDRDFHGGNFATPHREFYKDTVLTDVRAPDHGDLDIIEAVLPKAKARGVRVYAWAEDVWRGDVPRIEQVQEVDVHGRRRSTLCLRNPNYLHFLEGLMRDYASSYALDGIMWGCERQGPLGEALGASHGGGGDAGRVGCFCPFCRSAAKQRGIDAERAVAGYTALEQFVKSARGGKRPRDGYFVEFWRILFEYPEILAWEKLWSDGQHASYRTVVESAKDVRRDIPVGFHVWHLNSFSPFWRAQQDYAKLAAQADFFKAVVYNNCGGPRFAGYIDNVHRTLFRDLDRDEVYKLHSAFLGYEEKPLGQLPTEGLSADYVYRETKRAMEGVAGKAAIYPGIDIDIPTGTGQKHTTPEDVRDAVKAAFRAEADGVILSRKYSEMRLANLSGAGQGLHEAGLVNQ